MSWRLVAASRSTIPKDARVNSDLKADYPFRHNLSCSVGSGVVLQVHAFPCRFRNPVWIRHASPHSPNRFRSRRLLPLKACASRDHVGSSDANGVRQPCCNEMGKDSLYKSGGTVRMEASLRKLHTFLLFPSTMSLIFPSFANSAEINIPEMAANSAPLMSNIASVAAIALLSSIVTASLFSFSKNDGSEKGDIAVTPTPAILSPQKNFQLNFELHSPPNEFHQFVNSRCSVFSTLETLSKADVETKWNGYTTLSKPSLPSEILTPGNVFQRQILVASDGGLVALDWPSNLDLNSKDDHMESILLLVPGPLGDLMADQVKEFALVAQLKGMFPVILHARGFGNSPVSTPRLFSAGDSDDLALTLDYLSKARLGSHISAVGWGLGANLMVKYLGETGEKAKLNAAVSINNPFDLTRFAQFLRMRENKESEGVLLKQMLNALEINKMLFRSDCPSFDLNKALESKTILEFDDAITRVALHAPSLNALYESSSSKIFTPYIKTPLLLLHNNHDPFSSFGFIPLDSIKQNPFLTMVVATLPSASSEKKNVGSMESIYSFLDKNSNNYLIQNIAIQWLESVELALLKGKYPPIDPSTSLPLVSFPSSNIQGLVDETSMQNVSNSITSDSSAKSDVNGPIKSENDTNQEIEKEKEKRNTENEEINPILEEKDFTNSQEEQLEEVLAAKSVLNLLDITMPGSLTSTQKEKILSAVGRGKNFMAAMDGAVPPEVKENMTVVISDAIQANKPEIKLINLSKLNILSNFQKSTFKEASQETVNLVDPGNELNSAESTGAINVTGVGNELMSDSDIPSDASTSESIISDKFSDSVDASESLPTQVESAKTSNSPESASSTDSTASTADDSDTTKKKPNEEKHATGATNSSTPDLSGEKSEAISSSVNPRASLDDSSPSLVKSKVESTNLDLPSSSSIPTPTASPSSTPPPISSPAPTISSLTPPTAVPTSSVPPQSPTPPPSPPPPPPSPASIPRFDTQGNEFGIRNTLSVLANLDNSTQMAVTNVFQVVDSLLTTLEESADEEEVEEVGGESIVGGEEAIDDTQSKLKEELVENSQSSVNDSNSKSKESINLSQTDTCQEKNLMDVSSLTDGGTKNEENSIGEGGQKISAPISDFPETRNDAIVEVKKAEGTEVSDSANPEKALVTVGNRECNSDDSVQKGVGIKKESEREYTTESEMKAKLDDIVEESGSAVISEEVVDVGVEGSGLGVEKIDFNDNMKESGSAVISEEVVDTGVGGGLAVVKGLDDYVEGSGDIGEIQELVQEQVEDEEDNDPSLEEIIASDTYLRLNQALRHELSQRLGEDQMKSVDLDKEVHKISISIVQKVEEKNKHSAKSGVSIAPDEMVAGFSTEGSEKSKEKKSKKGIELQLIVEALSSVVGGSPLLARLVPLGTLAGVAATVLSSAYLVIMNDLEEEDDEKIVQNSKSQNQNPKPPNDKVPESSNTLANETSSGKEVEESTSKHDTVAESSSSSPTQIQGTTGPSMMEVSNSVRNEPVDRAMLENNKPILKKDDGRPVEDGIAIATSSDNLGIVANKTASTIQEKAEVQTNTLNDKNQTKQVATVGIQDQGIKNEEGIQESAKSQGVDDNEENKMKNNGLGTIAEKVMLVSKPVLPHTPDGKIDQDKLVNLMAEYGRRGGYLNVVGKFALLWGGIRQAIRVAEKLIAFFKIHEKPLFQRLSAFVGMGLLLWTPVLIPLLPSILTQFAMKQPLTILTECALIFSLYSSFFLLVQIWGKKVRGYEKPLKLYGLRLLSRSRRFHLFSGFSVGFLSVALLYFIQSLMGFGFWNIPFFRFPEPFFLENFISVFSSIILQCAKSVRVVVRCLFVAFAISLVEEVLFRSWLQEELAVDLGFHLAAVFSATIFSVVHWSAPAIPGLFLLSLTLLGMKMKAKGLSLPIGFHSGLISGYSLIYVQGLYSPKSSPEVFWLTGEHVRNPLAGALGIAMLLLLTTFFYPWGWKRNDGGMDSDDDKQIKPIT